MNFSDREVRLHRLQCSTSIYFTNPDTIIREVNSAKFNSGCKTGRNAAKYFVRNTNSKDPQNSVRQQISNLEERPRKSKECNKLAQNEYEC